MNYKLIILVMITILGISQGLINLSVSPLFPTIMEQYQINRTTVSLLMSVQTMISIPFGIIAGLFVAKLGLKWAFFITALAMCAGILTILAANYTLLLITRVLFGVGVGLFAPVASALVMRRFTNREFPLANGFIFISASIGSALVMFIAVPLNNALGWRLFLTVLGVVPLLLAVIWLFLSRETDRTNTNDPNMMNIVSGHKLVAVFKYRSTYLLALAFSGPVALLLTDGSWLPTYYNEVFHLPMAQASNIVGVFNFVGIAAAICGMVLPAKVGLRRPFFIVPGFIIGIAGLGSILINNLPIIYISIILLGACIWVFLPSLLTLPMELPEMNPKQVAMMVGVVFAIGNTFSFVAPITVGYLRDVTGSYLPGLCLWSIVSFSLAISGILLPETGPKGRKAGIPLNV